MSCPAQEAANENLIDDTTNTTIFKSFEVRPTWQGSRIPHTLPQDLARHTTRQALNLTGFSVAHGGSWFLPSKPWLPCMSSPLKPLTHMTQSEHTWSFTDHLPRELHRPFVRSVNRGSFIQVLLVIAGEGHFHQRRLL